MMTEAEMGVTSTSQKMPRAVKSYEKLRRRQGVHFPLDPPERTDTPDPFILDFWPSEPPKNEFLLSEATQYSCIHVHNMYVFIYIIIQLCKTPD